MRIKLYILVVVFTISALLYGCSQTADIFNESKNDIERMDESDDSKVGKMVKFEELGLEYIEPKAWAEKRNVSILCVAGGEYGSAYILADIPYEFVPANFIEELMKQAEQATTEDAQFKLYEKYKSKSKEIFEIVVLDKDKEETGPQDEIKRKTEIFDRYDHSEKVGEKDGLECYLLYNETYDKSGLIEEEIRELEEALMGIEILKKNIKIFTPYEPEDKLEAYESIQFEAKTIDGRKIDSSIFNNSKLTMVNIWATYCGPCIDEMPDLQELYDEVMDDDINVIGIIADTPDPDTESVARKIIDNNGVMYENIIPDERLINGLLKDITGVPTTIFVDDQGNIVGEHIVGSRSKEDYKTLIEETLGRSNQ